VDVTVPATGEKRNLVILDDADAVSASELEQRRERLAGLKFHPREDSRNQALLARAQRCYEGFIGERRELVSSWLMAFEAALESQDPRLIADAQRELGTRLDALEGERFL